MEFIKEEESRGLLISKGGRRKSKYKYGNT